MPLQLDEKTNNAAYTLRQVYQKHLLAYEEYNGGRGEGADSVQCQPSTASSSESRDDAEEAADILNAIMGLSAIPQQRAPAKKPNRPVGRVCHPALTSRLSGTELALSARASYLALRHTLVAGQS